MQSKQQQKLNFCWQSNDKRSVQPWDGGPYRASKRHRRALPYLFPMAALPRVFCCSEIREWNDPALVFLVVCCVVFGRERRKGEADNPRHDRGDLPEEDQRASRSPAGSRRMSRRCKRKEEGQKVALSDTLSDRDGGGHAGWERPRGRRWSCRRCGRQHCQWERQTPWWRGWWAARHPCCSPSCRKRQRRRKQR